MNGPESHSPPSAPSLAIPRFDIEEEAARQGGIGTIHRGRDRETGQAVAIKVLRQASPAEVTRFRREAELLSKLSHPAIVRHVAHAFLPTGEPYLVMEWLSGESLADRLARGPLSPGETLAVAKRVASALAFAHSRGLVHRDIKPGNIFLVDRQVESATLIDFGVAHSEFISAEITDVGTMVGTLGYMAPEQARGDREVDARADFFSLGCVIFKCLTGRTPFVGDNLTSILAKTLFEDAPRLRDLTPEVAPLLDALVARLLSKNPLARPASATALVEDLERIPLDEDISGGPYPSGSRRGITAGEQHLVSVVLATAPNVGALDDTLGAAPTSDDGSTLAELHAIAAKFGATMAPLANGLVVATLSGTASAMDQAAAAARCALAMAQSLGSAQVVLATGRGMLGSGLPVGVAIDRAVHLLGVRRPSSPTNPVENASVLVDDVTAGLLDAQFVMMEEQLGAFRIVRERSVQEVGRTLLGRPTPFVGRNRELGVLCTVFDACVDEGRAQCVLVTGDPGVGKSRLRYEFLRGLRTKHIPMEIWSARGEPMAAGAPLRVLSHALRSALGLVDSESLEASRERIRLRVAKHVPPSQSARVSEFMGEWVGVPFPDEDSVQLRAARRNAILRGDQMRRAFFDFIEAESAAQPVLLVLEDMQWGDEATCELIDAALQRLKHRPFLVLSLGRPEMLDRFPRLWEKRSPLRVDVSELSPQASEKLAREVLKDRATPTTIRRLVDRADGNAFFLEELIRAVAFETVEVALPETVVAVVQARLASRNAEERRILRAASVFGDTFPVGGVAAILGEELSATSVRARLDQLALDELVYRRPISRLNGEVEYAFRHARVREAAYATLTESDRSLAHHLAGQWLSLAGERDAFALAEHFERAGAYSNATEWYRRAAEQALEADKLDLAIDRAERGVRGASGETLGMLRLLQSEAHTWRGEYAEALARGDEAMQWLPMGGEMWAEAAGQVAEACGRLGLYDKLSQLAVSLDQLSGGEHSGRVLIARVRAATQLMYAGRFESAQSLIDAAEASRPYFLAHEPAIVAWIDYALSVRALFAGDLGDNVRLKESVIENFEKAGDHRNACMQRVRLGYGWIVVGSAREGERVLREALMEARRAGLAKASALAKHNLGLALLRLGQHKEAATLENEALVAFAAQGDRRLCAASHLYLAWIWEALGDGEQAEFHAKETIAHQEPNSPMYAEALATLAELRLRSDKAADAFEPALRAHELMLKLGAVEDSEALIRLVYARTLHGAGSVALGKRALAEAKARLLERAQRIRDPELRRGFLEDEPVNRSTMSLASDWLS